MQHGDSWRRLTVAGVGLKQSHTAVQATLFTEVMESFSLQTVCAAVGVSLQICSSHARFENSLEFVRKTTTLSTSCLAVGLTNTDIITQTYTFHVKKKRS